MSIPHLFRCPISLDLFIDPVTLSTGQTYDRSSIEKWLSGGNSTCPVTMQRLKEPSLVPNHTLRHLIDQWLLSGIDAKPRPNSEPSLTVLRRILSTNTSKPQSKLEALRKIKILSSESDTGRDCLIQLGFFPLLLDFLFRSDSNSSYETIELVSDCVLRLSPSKQLESLNVLKQRSNLSAMVSLLEHGTGKIRSDLCRLIELSATIPDLSIDIGSERRVFRVLISLLGSQTPESEAAIRAVSSLCKSESNRAIAVEENIVEGVVKYLSGMGRRNVAEAVGMVEAVVASEKGRKAVVGSKDGIKVLVKMVFRMSASDDGGSERAVGALVAVCGDATAQKEAVSAGVLSQLLLLLQSQCGSRAKAKARGLLKLLSCSVWDDGC